MDSESKPRILVFGSCMSNITASFLQAEYEYDHYRSIHHNRSDAFISYYIDRDREPIPRDVLERELIYKPQSEAEARQFLHNQYPEGLGFHDLGARRREGKTLLDDLNELTFNIILLDNFMDVAAKLVYWKTRPEYAGQTMFLNLGFYENEAALAPQFWHTEYLEPQQSAANWVRIYHWLRALQPQARFYFLPYHYCSSQSEPERYERIFRFQELFTPLAKSLDMTLFPAFNVAPALTCGEKDWPHFQTPIYRALAGTIFLDYEARLLSWNRS